MNYLQTNSVYEQELPAILDGVPLKVLCSSVPPAITKQDSLTNHAFKLNVGSELQFKVSARDIRTLQIQRSKISLHTFPSAQSAESKKARS